MTVKFYVAECEYQCHEEDADFVRYNDYIRLQLAAKKALACLNMYKTLGLETFTLEAIDDLIKALEG